LKNWLLQEKIGELAFTGKNYRIGFYRKKLENWLLRFGGQNWFKIRVIIK